MYIKAPILMEKLSGFVNMSLNDTPSANRVHIGFFGRRNAGKSSVVNAVTGQELSVVSDTLGTTTDPVSKSMELLPLGPVVILDTPGYDDVGALGALRVRRTRQVLNRCDLAVLVVDDSLLLRLLLMTAALVLIYHIPAVIRLFRGTEPRLSLEKDITYKLDQ